MQRQPRRRLLEHLQRVELRVAQRRYYRVWTGIVTPQRCNVVGIDFVPDSAAVALGVEDARTVPGVLPLTDFAFAVEVPVWSCEGFDYVGVLAL